MKESIEDEVETMIRDSCDHICHKRGLNAWMKGCPVCGCPNPAAAESPLNFYASAASKPETPFAKANAVEAQTKQLNAAQDRRNARNARRLRWAQSAKLV